MNRIIHKSGCLELWILSYGNIRVFLECLVHSFIWHLSYVTAVYQNWLRPAWESQLGHLFPMGAWRHHSDGWKAAVVGLVTPWKSQTLQTSCPLHPSSNSSAQTFIKHLLAHYWVGGAQDRGPSCPVSAEDWPYQDWLHDLWSSCKIKMWGSLIQKFLNNSGCVCLA